MKPRNSLLYILIAFVIGFGTAINPAVHNYLVENEYISNNSVSIDVSQEQDKGNAETSLESFWQTYEKIKDEYVDANVFDDQNKIGYGAAKGLVKELDDAYSSYLDPKEATTFRDSLNGELEGIGAEITIKDDLLTVVTPLKESPAEKAGVQPGDYIYKVDGTVTDGLNIREAVQKIRGEKGTSVVLTIIREGLTEPLDIEVIRDHITVDSVTWEIMDGNIMHVSINQFSESTAREFKEAVKDILIKDAKGVVVDLRFNGGGYLESAVKILSEVIGGKEKIVVTKGRKADNNKVYYSDGSARIDKLPLVVLVNRGSASASEIVAGAIQDLKRGLLIGEKTFGKGSVQEVFNLPDDSNLILTVAKWYTPLDHNVDKKGLVPDRVVPMSSDDYTNDRDPQLDEAVKFLKEQITQGGNQTSTQ